MILVADDDPFNLRLLTELCEAAGYDVIACGDGQSVLDLLGIPGAAAAWRHHLVRHHATIREM